MTGPHGLPQFVNPQHTDKFFNDSEHDRRFSTPRISHEQAPPFLSTPSSSNSGEHIGLSDGSQSFLSEHSMATSLGASPVILTPASSNSSSRRQSLIIPEAQQYFLADCQDSPTPAMRSHSVMAGRRECFPDPDTSLINRAGMDWQFLNGVHSVTQHNPSASVNVDGCLGIDLEAGFDSTISSFMTGAPEVCVPAISSFSTVSVRYRSDPQVQPTTVHNTAPPLLAAPFSSFTSPELRLCRPDTPDSDYKPKPSRSRKEGGVCQRRKRTTTKNLPPKVESRTHGHHPCTHPGCPLHFKRPEHLKRHAKIHDQNNNYLPCAFYDPSDPDGGHSCKQTIKDRQDNMRAHLQTTHFKYGKMPKSGKNVRKTMKQSLEHGVRIDDHRWDKLLKGEIQFGDQSNWYYQMLGYSIQETQEIRISDFIPDWNRPEIFLKEFDPRWKKLLQGDMTFEQAMERGQWMPETESQGILGVDMKTTARMGLASLDPRWSRFHSGMMTFKEAKVLAVAHLDAEFVFKDE